MIPVDERSFVMPAKFSLDELRSRMQKSIASLKDELSGLRTGRASASLLENFIDETERRTWFLFEASRQTGDNAE